MLIKIFSVPTNISDPSLNYLSAMREKTKQSLVVKAFIKSNKRDDIIEIKPNKKAIIIEN